MSDYLAAQKAISFAYDSNLEVVTDQEQKLGLASSGTLTLNRPDKLHATRTGGFANVEMVYDGKTLTMLGKNANVFAKADGFVLQFARELGTLERILTEKRFQLGILDCCGCLAKTFLAVFKRFDQAVDRRNNFFLLAHIFSIRMSGENGCLFSHKICGDAVRPYFHS